MRTTFRNTTPETGPARDHAVPAPLQSWNLVSGLHAVWLHRKYVVAFTILTMSLSAAYYWTRPNRYTATATLLPPQSNDQLTAMAGAFPGLMSALGGSRPHADQMLYPAVLQSRSVIEPLLAVDMPTRTPGRSTTLAEILDAEDPERARTKFCRKMLKTSLEATTGICRVSVTMTDPITAAAVCNALIESMVQRGVQIKSSGAGQLRGFLSGRLGEVQAELSVAEKRLEAFRERNRNYNRAAAPDLVLEDERLAREVNVKSALYLRLSEQYELARIEEKRDIGNILILDHAQPPTVKSGPHRIRATLLSGLGAAMVAVAAILLFRFVSETILDPLRRYGDNAPTPQPWFVRRHVRVETAHVP